MEKSIKTRILAILILTVIAVAIPFVLFLFNGVVLANGERAISGVESTSSVAAETRYPQTIRIMSFNVAKCFVDVGMLGLRNRDDVEHTLDGIVQLVRRENPDLLFLSEVCLESGWGGVDQVGYLSRETGLTNWVFGENICFGFPTHRVVCGNAILSGPIGLSPIGNPDLPGRKPFWVTRNNRRVLIAECRVGSSVVTLHSIHNDSFSPSNNLLQIDWLLDRSKGLKSVFAGDFNAHPDSRSILALLADGNVSGVILGPATYPNDYPVRTIDYVFTPKKWGLLGHSVITNELSDHCAVLSEFEVR